MSIQPMTFSSLPARPLVSVVVANYNYERYVCRAIESLQGQTWRRWEAVICDDGSADRSAEIIASYAGRDPRVRLVRQANGGMASALNRAVALTGGELIALLDSDDEYLPERLEAVIERFRSHPEAGVVCHPLRAVRVDGEVIKAFHPRLLAEGWLGPGMLRGVEPALPPCSGLTFRREVAERVFPLPERFRRCADKVAQDRAALLAPVTSLREPLALYRIHGANLTGLSGPVTLEAVRSNLEFLEALWADRAEFIRRWHGFEADVTPWREVESAHFFLAARLLGSGGDSRIQPSSIPSAWKRNVWRLLLAMPRPAALAALRLWWTENAVKRNLRLVWDFVAGPPAWTGRAQG
ncbi:MAG: glycosyltransferase family 2 protein [Bryobacteraceae bacterium]|nr:glycosyltransferase family 2 protein [Bryobacteraceae bacterium]